MSVEVSSPQPINSMTVLQNRWYNGLVGNLPLSSDMFQLSQPSPPIPPSDAGLWTYENALPPASLTFNHITCSGDMFFNEYAAVAVQMQLSNNSFEQDIGESAYQEWMAYLSALDPPPSENQLPALFQRWAMRNAPSVVSVGVADLTEMNLIGAAQQALQPYLGANAKPPDFTGAYADLLQTIGKSQGCNLSFDSNTTSGDVNDTWTNGRDSGVSGLWAGSCSASRLSRAFAASNVSVKVQIKGFLVWTSTPGKWYNSSLLNLGYSNQATPPWPETPNPTWADLFGPEGSLQRFITSLVVIDGVNAAVASDAIYAEADRQNILDNAPSGLWPFYAPDSDSVSNEVTFDASGMHIEIVTQPGNPLVLGANVLGIARYLGHGSA